MYHIIDISHWDTGVLQLAAGVLFQVSSAHLSHHGLESLQSQFEGKNLSRFTKTEALDIHHRRKPVLKSFI